MRIPITSVTVAGLRCGLGVLPLIGGGRFPNVDLLTEATLVVATDVALVAGIRLEQFTFGHGALLRPGESATHTEVPIRLLDRAKSVASKPLTLL
jgi:hypothetical protein